MSTTSSVDTRTHSGGLVGDRLVGFTVMLPAEAGPDVLLATRPMLADALRQRYPQARLLRPEEPLGRPDLAIVDASVVDPATLSHLLEVVDPDAVVAVLGPRGPHAIYPDTDHPQHLWRRGWPVPHQPRRLLRWRRRAGLLAARRREVPHLALHGGPTPSLADRVATDLAAHLGESLRLVGVVTAGRTILRFRRRNGDEVAVRLSLTPGPADRLEQVRTAVPAVALLVPRPLVTGSTAGVPWEATTWLQPLPAGQEQPLVAELVDVLAARPTGRTYDGWAATRIGEVELLPMATCAVVAPVLSVLDRGIPTGWCHGDLWWGNLLHDGTRGQVIDWDNADDSAPTGLDHLLAAALRWIGEQRRIGEQGQIGEQGRSDEQGSDRDGGGADTFAAALTTLVDDPTFDDPTFDAEIGGRAWPQWPRRERVAFAVAAHLLHLRNRSLHDLGEDGLRRELADLHALVGTADVADPRVDQRVDPFVVRGPDDTAVSGNRSNAESTSGPAGEPTSTSRNGSSSGGTGHPTRGTTRGAGWLGLGAGTVKGAQTAVLLVLAALLAPADIGVLAIGALVLNVSSAVTDLGTSTALVHWRGNAERAARSALALAVGLALAITGSVWLAAPWLAGALHAGDLGTDVVRGLILCLPLAAVSGVSQELLRRELAFTRRVLPDIAGAVAGTGLTLALAFSGHGAMSLVAGQLLAAALVTLLCWCVRPVVVPGWNREDVRGLVSYGGHLAGANIVKMLMLNVDYVLVARILGATAVGVYSMAFRLAYMPVVLVAIVLCGAAFPRLCRLTGRAHAEALADLAAVLAAVMVPLHLGMVLLADQLELLGAEWAAGVPPLRWLACFGLVLAALNLCIVALNSSGRTRDTLVLNLAHLALLTGLLTWWTRFGVEAAAGAQAAAVTGAVLLGSVLMRARGLTIAWAVLARRLVPVLLGAVLLAAVVAGGHHLLPWTRVSWAGLVLVGGAGLVAYALPELAVRTLRSVRTVGTASTVRSTSTSGTRATTTHQIHPGGTR